MEIQEFIKKVEEIYDSLPEWVKESLDNLEITVEERDSGYLLGLYRGVPLTKRGIGYNFILPDKIVLYKYEIEKVANFENISVEEKIRKVLLHEIGHYLGYNEEKLRELGGY
ncbi:MAG TPA: metallopeptidase family protein [Caldisericia bacterium]|nr:metallopeptidase family protein [Caldisericia bacterium]